MTYIPVPLRRFVFTRSGGRCEYCLLHQDDIPIDHEFDHIFAEKHGGETIEANLCTCCFDCNRHKGTDLTSIDPETQEIVPLFHPSRDIWTDHFKIEHGRITGLTPKGRVTVRLLDFNDIDRVKLRASLMKIGRYP